MFKFLSLSQNIELYAIVILLLLAALPLDTIFVNMWLVLFVFALVIFITG